MFADAGCYVLGELPEFLWIFEGVGREFAQNDVHCHAAPPRLSCRTGCREFDGLGFAGAGRYRILRVQASAFSRDAGVGFCVFVLVERGVAAWVLVLERLLRPLWNQTTAGRSPLPERVR